MTIRTAIQILHDTRTAGVCFCPECVPNAGVYRAPTVGMPDAHDSIGAGCYRARALPGAE